MTEIYRFTFGPDVPSEEVAASLLLAILATESLHGEAQTRLDAVIFVAPALGVCVIDASTSVGRDLNRLFVGFLTREFGADAFAVERIVRDAAA